MPEPHNLGRGWAGFDFQAAFDRPTKVVNDALMQAIGSYQGGRMLFLGLGTGLGSAMIVDGVFEPMELGHLPYRKDETFEDYVGAAGLERRGTKKWRKSVDDVIARLSAALEPDYIVLGGGNADKVDHPPPKVRFGDNANAFEGGFRLWKTTARKPRARALTKPELPPNCRNCRSFALLCDLLLSEPIGCAARFMRHNIRSMRSEPCENS